jgi:hypothetical protein
VSGRLRIGIVGFGVRASLAGPLHASGLAEVTAI